MERALIVRPDRLGDVILSLPTVYAFKKKYPGTFVAMAVQPWIAPLLQGQKGMDEVIAIHSQPDQWTQEIRSRHFDAAVILQSQMKTSLGVFKSGIPLRIGPVNRLHTWFLFNQRVRQRRSKVEKHEAQYNLDLLKPLGFDEPDLFLDAPQLEVTKDGQHEFDGWRKSSGKTDRYVVVHPGMGGSAENWPEKNYQTLVKNLSDRGISVVISAGPGETKLAERVKGDSSAKIIGGSRPFSLVALAALFKHAKVVVAPSTGPLHLAAAVGTPVVSFYPTIQVQSAKRWGPIARQNGKSKVFEPSVRCREKFRCAGRKCQDYPCMEKISTASVQDAVIQYYEA